MLQFRDVYPRSRILIFIYPGSRIPDAGSWIPDPGAQIQPQQQKRQGKKSFVLRSYLYCSQKYHKTENYFTFDLEKKIWEPI
jgi:hypothetical protein